MVGLFCLKSRSFTERCTLMLSCSVVPMHAVLLLLLLLPHATHVQKLDVGAALFFPVCSACHAPGSRAANRRDRGGHPQVGG